MNEPKTPLLDVNEPKTPLLDSTEPKTPLLDSTEPKSALAAVNEPKTLLAATEPKTLLLTETGVESMPDGSTAVNVGPIVRALEFLTEGRGQDRGTDEAGNPLPDLMSLAFDVVEAIILGGRKAEFFRQVKRDLEARGEGSFRSSLVLAKQARRVHAPAAATALDRAADTLHALLGELSGLSLDEAAAQELKQALESFRAFGADRWVSATSQLLIAVRALSGAPASQPVEAAAAPRKRRTPPARSPRSKRAPKPKAAPQRAASKPKAAPQRAASKPAAPQRAAPKPKATPRRAASKPAAPQRAAPKPTPKKPASRKKTSKKRKA